MTIVTIITSVIQVYEFLNCPFSAYRFHTHSSEYSRVPQMLRSEMFHFCNISEQSSQMLHDFGRFFCNILEPGVSPGSLTSFRD